MDVLLLPKQWIYGMYICCCQGSGLSNVLLLLPRQWIYGMYVSCCQDNRSMNLPLLLSRQLIDGCLSAVWKSSQLFWRTFLITMLTGYFMSLFNLPQVKKNMGLCALKLDFYCSIHHTLSIKVGKGVN